MCLLVTGSRTLVFDNTLKPDDDYKKLAERSRTLVFDNTLKPFAMLASIII